MCCAWSQCRQRPDAMLSPHMLRASRQVRGRSLSTAANAREWWSQQDQLSKYTMVVAGAVIMQAATSLLPAKKPPLPVLTRKKAIVVPPDADASDASDDAADAPAAVPEAVATTVTKSVPPATMPSAVVAKVAATPLRPQPNGPVASTADGRLEAFSDGCELWLRRRGTAQDCRLGGERGAVVVGFSGSSDDSPPWLVVKAGTRVLALQPEEPEEPVCLSPSEGSVKVGQTFVGKSEVLMELEGMGPGPAALYS